MIYKRRYGSALGKPKKAEAEAKADTIYRATDRTKICPENELTRNYIDINPPPEKKREGTNGSSRFESGSKILEFLEKVIMHYLVSFFSSVCV